MSKNIGCLSIPEYTITGVDGNGDLIFDVNPPTDGSVFLAFFSVDPAFGRANTGGGILGDGRLMIFINAPSLGINFSIKKIDDTSVSPGVPLGWAPLHA
jgi:hypothetical protein